MTRFRAGILTVVLAASLSTVASARPVAAAQGQACFENVVWTFSPPLTTVRATGTTTFAWTDTCAVPATLPGVSLYSASGSESFTYTGDCTLATFAGADSGNLIGGTLAVMNTNQAYLLVPASRCNDAGPTPSTGVQITA